MLKFVRKRPCIQQQRETTTTKQPRRRRSDDDDGGDSETKQGSQTVHKHTHIYIHQRRNTCAGNEGAGESLRVVVVVADVDVVKSGERKAMRRRKEQKNSAAATAEGAACASESSTKENKQKF